MSSRKNTLVPAEQSVSVRKVYGKSTGDNISKTLITLEDISKSESRKRKYTLRHQICLDILEGGFHQTFSEIHHLFGLQLSLRRFYGTDSAFYLIPLLETQSEKLVKLKNTLETAEQAKRKGDYRKVYVCYENLAIYFLQTGDGWLTDYCFGKALVYSENLTDQDGGQAKAEATYHVAQCHERNESMANAIKSYEDFYDQSLGKSWVDQESSLLLNLVAAQCLVRVYTILTEDPKYSAHIQLQKAYEIAKKSGDYTLIADACYRLGLQILNNDRSQANIALKYFTEATEASDKLGDTERKCSSQRILAQCYDILGNKEKSLRALMVFRELAEATQNANSIALAHLDFGAACNNDGDYNRAVSAFTKAYTTALTGGQPAQLEVARAWVGIAMAHDYLASFSKLLSDANLSQMDSVKALATWKASRTGLSKGTVAS